MNPRSSAKEKGLGFSLGVLPINRNGEQALTSPNHRTSNKSEKSVNYSVHPETGSGKGGSALLNIID